MKIKKQWFLAMAVVLLLLSVGAAVPNTSGSSEIRWDIVSINPPTNFNLNPGGIASARAENCSKITFTGSGTFVAPAGGGGTSSGVTGGGTWETFSGSSPCPCNSTATGTPTGSGTYEVTGLVRWEDAPGSLAGPIVDNIGVKADSTSGLAVLRIEYSDGERGVLVVSCHNPVGSPDTLFEGITATKGFVDYWNHQLAVNGVDANRTNFHVLRGPNN
jgi:hypothetical protein